MASWPHSQGTWGTDHICIVVYLALTQAHKDIPKAYLRVTKHKNGQPKCWEATKTKRLFFHVQHQYTSKHEVSSQSCCLKDVKTVKTVSVPPPVATRLPSSAKAHQTQRAKDQSSLGLGRPDVFQGTHNDRFLMSRTHQQDLTLLWKHTCWSTCWFKQQLVAQWYALIFTLHIILSANLVVAINMFPLQHDVRCNVLSLFLYTKTMFDLVEANLQYESIWWPVLSLRRWLCS